MDLTASSSDSDSAPIASCHSVASASGSWNVRPSAAQRSSKSEAIPTRILSRKRKVNMSVVLAKKQKQEPPSSGYNKTPQPSTSGDQKLKRKATSQEEESDDSSSDSEGDVSPESRQKQRQPKVKKKKIHDEQSDSCSSSETENQTNAESQKGVGSARSNRVNSKKKKYKAKKEKIKRISARETGRPAKWGRGRKRTLLPELDELSEVRDKAGVPTQVHFMKNLREMRRDAKGHDLNFPHSYASLELPSQTRRQKERNVFPNVYTWRRLKRTQRMELNLLPPRPKDNSKASIEKFKNAVAAVLKLLVQGAVGDCWLIQALYWLLQCSPEQLLWIFPKEQINDVVRMCLRIHNDWIIFEMDDYLPVYSDDTAKLAFVQRLENFLFACFLEKGVGRMHGSMGRLTGGAVGEGLSFFMEGAPLMFNPKAMKPDIIFKVIYQALAAGRCVTLGSSSKRRKDPLKNPDLPLIIYEHAFNVKKVYTGRFMKVEPVAVYAVKDVHDTDFSRSPLNPDGDLFGNLDEIMQGEINKDLAKWGEKGIIFLTTEGIMRRFDLLEVFVSLPPKPYPFVNGQPNVVHWNKQLVTMWEFVGNLNKVEQAYDCAVARGSTYNVVVATQLGQRIGLKSEKYFSMGLEVRDKRTNKVEASTQKWREYQVALVFKTAKAGAFSLILQLEDSEQPSAPFQLHFYSFQNHPKEKSIPRLVASTVVSPMCQEKIEKLLKGPEGLLSKDSGQEETRGSCKDQHKFLLQGAV